MKILNYLRKARFAVLLSALSFLTFCSSSDDEGSDPTPIGPDVYSCGFEISPTGATVAKLWKNGEPLALSNPNNIYPTSIFADGDDIYVSGYGTGVANPYGYYWKNGNQVTIGSGIDDYQVHEIFVYENDVYLVGTENTTTDFVGCYWKNGIQHNLPASEEARSIFIDASGVYVAGNYYDSDFNEIPKYWKNEVPFTLAHSGTGASTRSIIVKNNDVYISGYVINSSGVRIATVWKNGVATSLTDGTRSAVASKLYLDGTNVYAIGFENDAEGNPVAKYWKNGNPTNLANNKSLGTSIAVYGNDVYAAGWDYTGAVAKAKLWKNGQGVNLTDGTYHAGLNWVLVK